MSPVGDLLPTWSTVLLVLLLGTLAVSYWLIHGISVETLLASYRLISQGMLLCVHDAKGVSAKIVLHKPAHAFSKELSSTFRCMQETLHSQIFSVKGSSLPRRLSETWELQLEGPCCA